MITVALNPQSTTPGPVLTPLLVVGLSSSREANNTLHRIIGQASPDVTLAEAGLRAGSLTFLCQTLADALAMESIHAALGVIRLIDTDLPGLNMTYVPSGDISLEIDDETRELWTVEVDFAEVAV